MRWSLLVAVWVLGASVAASACSSDGEPAPSGTNGDAGTGGTGTSSGGRASGGAPAGGAGAGSGARAGSGGTSTGGGGAISGGGSGGTETGTGGAAPSCAPGSGEDAGLTWRDFEDGTCKACPATPLTECEHFTAAPGPSFDTATQVLTLHVQPGLNEVLGLRLEGRADTQGSTEFTFVDVDGAVSENVLTFDFSGKLPDGTLGFYEGVILGDDACNLGIDTSASQRFEIRFDATGAVDRMGCD